MIAASLPFGHTRFSQRELQGDDGFIRAAESIWFSPGIWRRRSSGAGIAEAATSGLAPGYSHDLVVW